MKYAISIGRSPATKACNGINKFLEKADFCTGRFLRQTDCHKTCLCYAALMLEAMSKEKIQEEKASNEDKQQDLKWKFLFFQEKLNERGK